VHRVAADGTAPFGSITEALSLAAPGDHVSIGPGTYSATTTGETYPLVVPPGVQVSGAGSKSCSIVGEGLTKPTWRPFREWESLVVLSDESSVRDVEIRGSGGSGIGVRGTARATISGCRVSEHALHGILVMGAEEVRIRDNELRDNGRGQLSVKTLRPSPLQPGENVFVVTLPGVANRVHIEGNLVDNAPGRDGLTVISYPDVHVRRNIIRGGRFAITLCASFGGSGHAFRAELESNEIQGAFIAALVGAAYPVVRRVPEHNHIAISFVGNVVADGTHGLLVAGGFAPSRESLATASVLRNRFEGLGGVGVRVIGGVAGSAGTVMRGTARAHLIDNDFERTAGQPVVVEGVAHEAAGQLHLADECSGQAFIVGNRWPSSTGTPILRRPGKDENWADVSADDQLVAFSKEIRSWLE
jgi:parallel beta-helix repeat protein